MSMVLMFNLLKEVSLITLGILTFGDLGGGDKWTNFTPLSKFGHVD